MKYKEQTKKIRERRNKEDMTISALAAIIGDLDHSCYHNSLIREGYQLHKKQVLDLLKELLNEL